MLILDCISHFSGNDSSSSSDDTDGHASPTLEPIIYDNERSSLSVVQGPRPSIAIMSETQSQVQLLYRRSSDIEHVAAAVDHSLIPQPIITRTDDPSLKAVVVHDVSSVLTPDAHLHSDPTQYTSVHDNQSESRPSEVEVVATADVISMPEQHTIVAHDPVDEEAARMSSTENKSALNSPEPTPAQSGEDEEEEIADLPVRTPAKRQERFSYAHIGSFDELDLAVDSVLGRRGSRLPKTSVAAVTPIKAKVQYL